MIKTFKKTTLACFLLTLSMYDALGQKSMYLVESFRSQSTKMPAKRKGISAIGKFEFGPYKVLSGKQGWTKTEGKGNFRGDSKSESVTKSSFEFQGINQEVIKAEILYTSMVEITEQNSLVFKLLTNWSSTEMEQQEFYVADYQFPKDTSQWSLVLSYPIIHDEYSDLSMSDLAEMFKGEIVSNEIRIEIVPELRLDNGKNASAFRPLEAYTFRLNDTVVGAVQVIPIPGMAVWIKDDLSDHLKNLLAVSAATMMIRSEQSEQ